MVSPDKEAQQRDCDTGKRNERVTEDLLLAVDGNQFTDDSHRRQNHDVNGRMAVEPKEVLEQNRVTAVLRIENSDVHRFLRDQHQQRDSQNRSRQYLND